MKKLLVLSFILLMAFSCTLPQYQLQFEITGVQLNSGDGNDVLVSYRMKNVGVSDIANVVLQIAVDQENVSSPSITGSRYASTTGVSLDVGDTVTGSLNLDIESGYQYVTGSARIYSLGWDTN